MGNDEFRSNRIIGGEYMPGGKNLEADLLETALNHRAQQMPDWLIACTLPPGRLAISIFPNRNETMFNLY